MVVTFLSIIIHIKIIKYTNIKRLQDQKSLILRSQNLVVYSKMIGKGSEIPNMTYDTYVIFSAKRLL